MIASDESSGRSRCEPAPSTSPPPMPTATPSVLLVVDTTIDAGTSGGMDGPRRAVWINRCGVRAHGAHFLRDGDGVALRAIGSTSAAHAQVGHGTARLRRIPRTTRHHRTRQQSAETDQPPRRTRPTRVPSRRARPRLWRLLSRTRARRIMRRPSCRHRRAARTTPEHNTAVRSPGAFDSSTATGTRSRARTRRHPHRSRRHGARNLDQVLTTSAAAPRHLESPDDPPGDRSRCLHARPGTQTAAPAPGRSDRARHGLGPRSGSPAACPAGCSLYSPPAPSPPALPTP